nr:MAG TPA: hypothetical protein [Caudoviricetes sp.]
MQKSYERIWRVNTLLFLLLFLKVGTKSIKNHGRV